MSEETSEAFERLQTFLSRFYTSDLRGVADKFKVPNNGTKSVLVHRLSEFCYSDPANMQDMVTATAQFPIVRKKQSALDLLRADLSRQEKLANEQTSNPAALASSSERTSMKRTNPTDPIEGNPAKRRGPIKLTLTSQTSTPDASAISGEQLPYRLPQVECICGSCESRKEPLIWCPHCKMLQHIGCIFGKPPGFDFDKVESSWDMSAAFLQYLHAKSFKDLEHDGAKSAWDRVGSLVLPRDYNDRHGPILHTWTTLNKTPKKGIAVSSSAPQRSGDLPMPRHAPNRSMTVLSSPLTCRVAACLRCSIVLMDPFRNGASVVSISTGESNPGPNDTGLNGIASSFDTSYFVPEDVLNSAAKIAGILAKRLPLVKTLFENKEDFKETFLHQRANRLTSRGCAIWEFRIPESYPRDNRQYISANIQGARFTLPVQWREMRKAGYVVEMRGMLIKDSGGRRSYHIKWPHEMELILNGQSIKIPAPDPHSVRKDQPIDISCYVHGGENRLELKMTIATEIIAVTKSTVSQAFGLGVILAKKIPSLAIARNVLERNLIELSVNQSLMNAAAVEGDGGSTSNDCVKIQRAANKSNYDWYKRLGTSPQIRRDDVLLGAKWLDMMNVELESVKCPSNEDDEIVMVNTEVDMMIKSRDCLAMVPIECPVRGRFCNHPQPLDLMTFLRVVNRMYPRANRYNCPLCEAEILPGDIIVDWDLWLNKSSEPLLNRAEGIQVLLDHQNKSVAYQHDPARGYLDDEQNESDDDVDDEVDKTEPNNVTCPASGTANEASGTSLPPKMYNMIDIVDLSDD